MLRGEESGSIEPTTTGPRRSEDVKITGRSLLEDFSTGPEGKRGRSKTTKEVKVKCLRTKGF